MGQTKYNNYKKILEENNYEICSFDEFVQTDKISYKCEKGHTTKMATTSFQNKKAKAIPDNINAKDAALLLDTI